MSTEQIKPVLDFKSLGKQAATSEDLTVNKSFEREIPRAGIAFLRLREYIELGRHESKNPQHKPSLKAILVFELSHPEHKIEIDGKKVPNLIQIRVNKGSTGKSGYRKLFKVMNKALGEKYTHFVEMIGEAFMGTIYHNVSGEGEKAVTYANLDLDGAWSLVAPVQLDVINNTTTTIPIEELDGTPRAFLWENASIDDATVVAMWNSIYIEGEREVDDTTVAGGKRSVSKNWMQETIMSNVEWEGSTTQALTQEHVSLEDLEVPATPAAQGAVVATPAVAESAITL